MAIKTFKHKGLAAFFNTGSKAKIQADHAKKLALILGCCSPRARYELSWL